MEISNGRGIPHPDLKHFDPGKTSATRQALKDRVSSRHMMTDVSAGACPRRTETHTQRHHLREIMALLPLDRNLPTPPLKGFTAGRITRPCIHAAT